MHVPGQHTHDQHQEKEEPKQKEPPKSPVDESKPEDNGLTKDGINSTLGKISSNMTKFIKGPKFRRGFMLNYVGIQGGVGKQFKKLEQRERRINKDLEGAEKGIRDIRNGERTKGIIGMLFNPMKWLNLAFLVIGGLVFLTLLRIGIKKWKDTYMPRPDGSRLTIFGVEIPGWDKIKAFGIGMYNFVRFGLPNWFGKIKLWINKTNKFLFGKKGLFKDFTTTKYSIIRILAAVAISMTKQVGGALMSLFMTALSFIPFVGPVFKVLSKIGPLIYAYIANKIVGHWSKVNMKEEFDLDAALAGQNARTKEGAQKLANEVLKIGGKFGGFGDG